MSGIHIGTPQHHGLTRPGRAGAYAGGVFQGVAPELKLGVLLVVVVGTAVLPVAWFWWHAAVGAGLAAVMAVGRVPLRPVVGRLVCFAPFVAGAAVAAVWHGSAGPGWRAIALRGGLCLAAVVVFGAVTPFAALPGVLRRWRVPALLVTTLALMHRYLAVLGDEAQRMRRARRSRTLVRPRWRDEWRAAAEVVGRLFVRASERAERVYLAMCARGWR